jgi:hypothetical protein
VNTDGEPCAGCEVFPKATGPSDRFPSRVTTDKDGAFRIEGLMPGVAYRLPFWEIKRGRVVGDGFIGEELTLKAGEIRDLGPVTGRLRGKE